MDFVKSGINLTKPNDVINEGVHLDEEQAKVLQPSFVSLIVGPPGSGKSFLIEQLITNSTLYLKKFNKLLFITPSPLQGLSAIMNESNWNTSLSSGWIRDRVMEYEKSVTTKNPSNILIILDDVIGEISKQKHEPEVLAMFFNRRHWLRNGWISILITTQKYVLLPPSLRSVLTSVYVFKPNYLDWDRIKRETNVTSNKRIDTLAQIAYKEKHNFIYFRLDTNQVFLNFDQVVFQ